MRYVGVRELKGRLSHILREVREEGEEYLITYRGRVVARLVPVLSPTEQLGEEKIRNLVRDFDRLVAEIGRAWPKGISAVDAVRDGRRDL